MVSNTRSSARINSLQQKFIDDLTAMLFSGRRYSDIQKKCFWLRFHPKNHQKEHVDLVSELNKQPEINQTFDRLSMPGTMRQIILKVKDKFAAEMAVDGVPLELLKGEKGRMRSDRPSPWEVVYNWFWKTKFPREGWQLAKDIAVGAMTELQMESVGGDRDFALESKRKQGEELIRKGKGYKLGASFRQDGYLLLINESNSGDKHCICPSRAYHLKPLLLYDRAMYIPGRDALAKSFKFNVGGDRYFLAIIAEKPLNLSWVSAEADARDILINEERLQEIFHQLGHQSNSRVFYKKFVVVD